MHVAGASEQYPIWDHDVGVEATLQDTTVTRRACQDVASRALVCSATPRVPVQTRCAFDPPLHSMPINLRSYIVVVHPFGAVGNSTRIARTPVTTSRCWSSFGQIGQMNQIRGPPHRYCILYYYMSKQAKRALLILHRDTSLLGGDAVPVPTLRTTLTTGPHIQQFLKDIRQHPQTGASPLLGLQYYIYILNGIVILNTLRI
ncbi:hypothetical protein BJV74DRAFT_485968 [Russula compacta]|nr:hypothetical protein BJV74DRAFT_485968 [Russula compacta]